MKTQRDPRRWLRVALPAAGIATAPGLALGAAYASSEPVAHVPIVHTRHQVRVPVSVNGSAPFQLILDTGMPTRGVLLRHTERVDALGLDFAGAETLSGGGSGQAVAARVANAERIELGGLAIPNVPVIVLPANGGLPLDTDGVIGAELFESFAVRIDVDHEELVLLDSARFQPDRGSAIVPIHFRERSAFLNARVTLDSGEPKTVELAIDLGAGHALWLNESEGRIDLPPGAIATTLGRGLSGEIRGSIGRVRRIELGDFTFESIVTLFPVSEHQHPGGADFRDGFVGAQLLTRFIVTFDYAGKRMVLEPGRRFAEPFEADMTGMVLNLQGEESRRVEAILAGSPAEEAGIEIGDVLVAVDGRTIDELGFDGLERMFKRDGAEVRVTLERGGTRIEKTLKLRRLV